MGAGLRIERPFSWRKWTAVWRLLGIAMPLSIIAIAFIAYWNSGLAWASALLLGAALAPTDPVLAADVEENAPNEPDGGEVRFHLTAEAGLNDGLAFPFVLLAMGLAREEADFSFSRWVVFDVLLRVGCGALVGYLSGRFFGWITFKMPRLKLSRTGDGLVALGVTLASYGIAEIAGGYGFVAVFVAALALRATDPQSEFHGALAEFSEQIARMLMVLVMVAFGATLTTGVLAPLTIADLVTALIIFFAARFVFAAVSLIGNPLPIAARLVIAFFGIRGIGTFYYLAYSANGSHIEQQDRVWAIALLVVLLSVVIHGVLSTPIMNWVDRRRRQKP
jgi:NhaP-type Na+/H+ or K+/H+ antiporter